METTKKVIAPAAINALAEALTHIYWYKPDLRRFLTHSISDGSVLGRLNWQDYKRNIVSSLVNFLAGNQNVYQSDLLRLMTEVCKINTFSHLQNLEDGSKKVQMAKQSVEALRLQLEGHQDLIEIRKQQGMRKKMAEEKMSEVQGMKVKLEEIKQSFFTLVVSTDPQGRGFLLEKIVNELFTLFDLDPKASFKIVGEQLDGAFTFDSNDYLFEAKWQQKPVGIDALYGFRGKIEGKLDNTLGLFLSIGGFSEDAIVAHSMSGKKMMLLMDGEDIMGVLDERIDLNTLLLRKRRHASQTGNVYFKLQDILLGK